jgi:hypothetical protein
VRNNEKVKRDAVTYDPKRGSRQRKKKVHTKQLSVEQFVRLDQLWNGVDTYLQRGSSQDLLYSLLANNQYWKGRDFSSPLDTIIIDCLCFLKTQEPMPTS